MTPHASLKTWQRHVARDPCVGKSAITLETDSLVLIRKWPSLFNSLLGGETQGMKLYLGRKEGVLPVEGEIHPFEQIAHTWQCMIGYAPLMAAVMFS